MWLLVRRDDNAAAFADDGRAWRTCRLASPLNPATVSRNFDKLVREAGLPKITLHGLRCLWASLALLEGLPSKVAGLRRGHGLSACIPGVT
jgi:hypothetical protein